MLPQFKSFKALQTVRSSIVSLCIIFKSIFEDSKVSYLIETKGLLIAFAQVLGISQLYQTFIVPNKGGSNQKIVYFALSYKMVSFRIYQISKACLFEQDEIIAIISLLPFIALLWIMHCLKLEKSVQRQLQGLSQMVICINWCRQEYVKKNWFEVCSEDFRCGHL